MTTNKIKLGSLTCKDSPKQIAWMTFEAGGLFRAALVVLSQLSTILFQVSHVQQRGLSPLSQPLSPSICYLDSVARRRTAEHGPIPVNNQEMECTM